MDELLLAALFALIVGIPTGVLFAILHPWLQRKRWEHGLYIDDEYYVFGWFLGLAVDDIVQDSSLLSEKPFLQFLQKIPSSHAKATDKPLCHACGSYVDEHAGRKLVKIAGGLMHEDCVKNAKVGVVPYYSNSKARFAKVKNLYHLGMHEETLPGIIIARVFNLYDEGLLMNVMIQENRKPVQHSFVNEKIEISSSWLMFYITTNAEFVFILNPNIYDKLKERLSFTESSENIKVLLRKQALLKDGIRADQPEYTTIPKRDVAKSLSLNEVEIWIKDVQDFVMKAI